MIEIFKLESYVRPDIIEKHGQEWVLNGDNNQFYQYIIDRYNGSPTNSAIIDAYSQMIYGLGLNIQIPLLPKKEVRRIVKDFTMFGMASFEVMYLQGAPVKIVHVPTEKLAPEKADEEGNITGYWYSYDWTKLIKYPPKRLDAFGFGKGAKRSEIFIVKDYQVGQFYFCNPSYLSALPYAELEEEIANFCINYVKNKFSVGTIINVNNGIPESEEERGKISRQYKSTATGTDNAGAVVVAFNDNKENATTVEQIQIVDGYQQYEFVSKHAQDNICTAHKLVSKSMIGISTASGFSSTADEIQMAFDETMMNVIKPKQEIILDAFQQIASMVGITTNLEFLSLRSQELLDNTSDGSDAKISYNGAQIASAVDIFAKVKEGILTVEQAVVFLIQFLNIPAKVAKSLFTGETAPIEQLSLSAQLLIDLGEDINIDGYELESVKPVDYAEEDAIKMATSTGVAYPNRKSIYDTDYNLYRYRYAGNASPEREFCVKMMKANKIYRREDIEAMGSVVVNPGFGMHPNPENPYSIWLYKGGGLLSASHVGGTCKHYWEKLTFKKKDIKVDVKNPLNEPKTAPASGIAGQTPHSR